MRILSTLTVLLLFQFALSAQPVNDDCGGLIALGALPACGDEIYDNIDATPSDIGFGNIPSCFNGGSVNRDVWFSFTTTDDIIDVTVTLQGATDGPNGSILNPQINIYRGECMFDGLADLSFCSSAADGEATAQVDIIGLTPNTTYFIRVNDYSPTGTPNAGDFRLCVEEYVPAINIGDETFSSACFGTLYDSGGPDSDYSNGENATFTITPSTLFECLEIQIQDFQLENSFDFLNIYAGPNAGGTLLGSYTGGNTDPITIQTSEPSITIEFTSDGSATAPGFELTWNCSPLACSGSSVDNPTVISGLPFEGSGFTTCGEAGTIAETPCGPTPFLNGPDFVFSYTTDGGFCADVIVSGADDGTGVLILDGPPLDPATECVGLGGGGSAFGTNFESPGTYYIIVANGTGCTEFNLSITEAECNLEPSLLNALCNPLNGCIPPDNLPSVFTFNQGFEDIAFNPGLNDGCWFNTGSADPNYYWFTIEAQSAGPFGFTVEAANLPAEDSDIDFQVWGPLDKDEVCSDPQAIVEFVENNQPIRSSYAGGADPTGLASIHPVTGIEVLDEFDCAPDPNGNVDDFASVINCQPGEVYAVLINDWGDDIQSGAISVDWSASDPDVLAPTPVELLNSDTAICQGESVQLFLETSVNNITWLKDTTTLSCDDCPDPLATPTETTEYVGLVDAVCYQDTVSVLVQVYDLDAGPDVTVCRNEEIQIVAGSNFLNATYEWVPPTGLSLSCTECPGPFIIAEAAGTYTLPVTLFADNCTLEDVVTITVLDAEAPVIAISPDLDICLGETVSVGGAATPGVDYTWNATPGGFTSTDADPSVTPDTTTTYYVSAQNQECPVPSLDSVTVSVSIPPVILLSNDTAVCQGDPLVLSQLSPEPGVVYNWAGPETIEDPAALNTVIFPQIEGTYTLTAVRGACEETASTNVGITPISIDILAEDTLRICRGEVELEFMTNIVPTSATPLWTASIPGFGTLEAPSITVSPQIATTYYAEVAVGSTCFRKDSVYVVVDSLPAAGLGIMPLDTTVCEGEILVLQSPLYEPSDFSGITFEWGPETGQESPDSLYNLVITGVDTVAYFRITQNGVCTDTSFAQVNVNPTPTITITPSDTTICNGNSVGFQATISDNATSFEWTGGTDQLSCTDCLNPSSSNLTQSTTFTLEASVGDCPAEVSANVNVLQPPPYELEVSPIICEGESIQLIFNTDPGYNYTWTATDPDFGTIEDGALTVTPDTTTTYFLVAGDGICPDVEDQVQVRVVQAAEINAVNVAPTDLCSDEEVTFSVDIDNAIAEDRYEWIDPNGNELATGQSGTFQPTVSGTYTLIYISAADCGTLTETFDLTVSPAPAVELANDTTICLGESVQLNFAEDENTTYTWTSTDPLFSDFNNPQPVVTPTETTTYTLTASNGVCDDFVGSVTVEVIGNILLDILPDDFFICPGSSTNIIAQAVGGSSEETFTWTGSDGSTYTGDNITVMPEDSTLYTLVYESGGGCATITDSVFIEVGDGVFPTGAEIIQEVPGDLFEGDSIILGVNYDSPFDPSQLNFAWTVLYQDSTTATPLGSGLGLDTLQTQIFNEGTHTFQVEITTPDGCAYFATVQGTFMQIKVGVPNTFTPNGDEQNDFFNFVAQANIEDLEVLEFKVYNRWGQLVYDNETPDDGWDGNANGKEQPTEVYFYLIRIARPNGFELGTFQGDVTLIR
jgi:gliding motility-associated-like protein